MDVESTSRWPWLASAGLITVAAAALGRSVWLHWTPCHGADLWRGLIVFREFDGGFSDACLRRMDAGTPYVFPTELAERTPGAFGWGAAAMITLGLVWTVLAVGLRLAPIQRLLLAVPAALQCATVAVAITEAQDAGWGPEEYSRWEWLDWIAEPTAVGVLIMVALVGTNAAVSVRLAVVAWACTVGGTFHQLGEYIAAVSINTANWDTPPGTGFGSVAGLIAAAVLIVVATLRRPAGAAPPAPPVRVAAAA